MKPRSGLDPASLTGRIAALDEQGSLDAVRERVQRGDDPLGIIADCQRGMQYVGEDYQSGEYFISGLIMAGEIFREAMEILEPLLPASAAGGAGAAAGAPAAAGSVLVCTVRGDIHDIGKSILVTLLRSHGFVVHDLGVDVPPAEVARRALELQPDVVGLSGLLTPPPPPHPSVIIIGGGAVDAQVCDWAGADLWAPAAVGGVELIRAAAKR